VVLCELKNELRGSSANGGMPDRDDSFAAASRRALLMAKLEMSATCRVARERRDEDSFEAYRPFGVRQKC